MAHDVFISYASKDKPKADAACAVLEARGIRCWIAPRDVLPGRPYGEAIIDGIQGCRVMVLILSSNANQSLHIPKEVERAVSRGVTIVPLRIEDVAPGRSLDYFIGSVHWLDALTPPLEQHLDNLAATVLRLLPEKSEAPEVLGVARQERRSGAIPASAKYRAALQGRSRLYLVAVGAVVFIAAGVILWRQTTSAQAPQTPNSAVRVAAVSPPADTPNSASIAGCWDWFSGGTVGAGENGLMRYGATSGRWRLVDAAQRTYEISWSTGFVDTVKIAPDGQSLAGANAQGVQVSAARSAGTCQTQGQSQSQAQSLSADQNSQSTATHSSNPSLRKVGHSILKHLTE